MRWLKEYWGPVVVVALVLVVFFLLAWAVATDAENWKAFKALHHCRIVAHIDGDVISTISIDSKGNPVPGIASTPSKTGWLCDDGVTYYR